MHQQYGDPYDAGSLVLLENDGTAEVQLFVTQGSESVRTMLHQLREAISAPLWWARRARNGEPRKEVHI